MPTIPYPITAESVDELKTQLHEMLRQLFEDKIGGLELGDVFNNSGDFLSLRLSPTGGLEKQSNLLQILNSPTGGLTSTSSGEAVFCKTGGGLGSDATGLYVTGYSGGAYSTDELDISGISRLGALRVGDETNNAWTCAGGIQFFNGTGKNARSGTWTASFLCGTSGTITLDANYKTGWWRKVDDIVFFGGRFVVGSVSSPVGSLAIAGLPFTATTSLANRTAVSLVWNNLVAGMSCYTGTILHTGSSIFVRGWADAAATTTTDASSYMQATSVIEVGGHYIL